MGLKNNYSDYGSGSSSSWMSQEDIRWSYQPRQTDERPTQKSSSYSDLALGRCTLDDVMREFKMNGSDSPYNPDEDRIWRKQSELSGIGLSGGYMRQKSWPEPDSTPAQRLPRYERMEFATSTPVFGDVPAPFTPELPQALPQAVPQTVPQALPQAVPQTVPQCVPQSEPQDYLTEEQSRVLSSLPAAVLHSLLQQLHAEKRGRMFQECRFCKNNGERESYYRSHVLKDALGRVACPVLRAFVCSRCGAHGDRAHTIKYCPLSSNEDRIKSTAMMRSVRMASGRRRYALSAAGGVDDYVLFGQVSPSAARDGSAYSQVPLDPLWAALEKKLLL